MANQDPEGKRIARRNASAAADALDFLAITARLIAHLQQSEIDEKLTGIRRDLRRFQSAEENRGLGHLDSRTKYKGRSQHLALEHGKGVVTLYLDESGQAQPSLDQPVFVLAGVAMDDVSATHYTERANDLKARFGISPSVCLHGPQIEKGVDEFTFQGDATLQSSFRDEVATLVRESDFKLIGAIIRKDALARSLADGEVYGNLPAGLYEMALTFVAERFVDALHYDQVLRPSGRLVFESIGNLEDALHQRAFAELLIHGSEFVSGGCFRGWLRPGCEFRTKQGSHPLELADLAARALLMWEREGRPGRHPFWELWADRISTRSEVERGKFGVKIFPDADIREDVLDFRQKVLKLAKRNEA